MASVSTCVPPTGPSSSTSDQRGNLVSQRECLIESPRAPRRGCARFRGATHHHGRVHSFCRVQTVKARQPTGYSLVSEMFRHPRAVHLVLGGEFGDGRSSQVNADEAVDLCVAQKGLRSCNRPHDWSTNVANRAIITPLRGAVYTTLPPLEQGVRRRVKVCEQSTQGPHLPGVESAGEGVDPAPHHTDEEASPCPS